MGKRDLIYLLDSVILIDHLNGIPQARAFLERAGALSGISVITRAEVRAGLEAHDKEAGGRLLDAFATFPIDRAIADRAADLRSGQRWKLPDAFQAAIALEHGLTLVTRNTKDFDEQEHGFVHVPYRL